MARKTYRITFATTEDVRIMLEKLAYIQERNMSTTLEYLVRKEARAEGLIEARNTLLDK